MTEQAPTSSRKTSTVSIPRTVGRIALGLALAFAGTTHLTVAREAFQAQVPAWVPLDSDLVVVLSGAVEITLGVALLAVSKHRVLVGLVVAGFFIAIFPGNISQYVTRTDAFGLDTDRDRFIRLLFQPLLVVWALWSTGAWAAIRRTWRRRARG
ncbi:membrane protein [Cryobacterium sp. MLB-32]|uniref:DoxX family protein n=1 Tax=Cryobacterium sp. MLB-32 TaxID=1529318 RepID=UPI0004E65D94|nr:membrane protein [Cryobacterium sp. MLB-32]KFF60771.1 membrane protein [Cryobacterium sp. MLB-32]